MIYLMQILFSVVFTHSYLSGQVNKRKKAQDIWPVTALNSFSQYIQAPNGAHSRRRAPDGSSRATDDLNRSKYGITDPPVGQLATQA